MKPKDQRVHTELHLSFKVCMRSVKLKLTISLFTKCSGLQSGGIVTIWAFTAYLQYTVFFYLADDLLTDVLIWCVLVAIVALKLKKAVDNKLAKPQFLAIFHSLLC